VVYTLFDSLHRLLGQTASAASVDAQFVNQTGCNPADLMTAMCHCVDDQVAAIMAEQASLLRGADLNLVVLAVKDRHLFVVGKGEFLVVEAGQRSPLAQGISAQSELPADPLADLGDFSDLFDEVASESADFLSTAAADAEPKGLPSPPAASSITLLTDAGCYLVFLPCVGESWALSAVDWSLTRPVAGEVSSLCRMVEQLVDPVHVEGGWVIESIPLHGAGTGVASDSPSADGSDWLGDGL